MNRKEYPPSDKTNLKLMITMTRCLQSINKKEFVLWADYNLTPSQFAVLEFLYHKGPANVKTIIDNNLSSGGNMTVVIDNLEKTGLAKRAGDETDRRAKRIHLTKKGEKLISEVFPKHVENLQKILEGLSFEEKESMIYLAKKLGQFVEETS